MLQDCLGYGLVLALANLLELLPFFGPDTEVDVDFICPIHLLSPPNVLIISIMLSK